MDWWFWPYHIFLHAYCQYSPNGGEMFTPQKPKWNDVGLARFLCFHRTRTRASEVHASWTRKAYISQREKASARGCDSRWIMANDWLVFVFLPTLLYPILCDEKRIFPIDIQIIFLILFWAQFAAFIALSVICLRAVGKSGGSIGGDSDGGLTVSRLFPFT